MCNAYFLLLLQQEERIYLYVCLRTHACLYVHADTYMCNIIYIYIRYIYIYVSYISAHRQLPLSRGLALPDARSEATWEKGEGSRESKLHFQAVFAGVEAGGEELLGPPSLLRQGRAGPIVEELREVKPHSSFPEFSRRKWRSLEREGGVL